MKERIFVDADSCPKKIKSIIQKAAVKNSMELYFVANRNIPFTTQNPLFFMQICDGHKDAADDWIFEQSTKDDLIITRDILFAKRLVQSGKRAINDRGTRFDLKNIEEMLEQRELSMQMQSLGLHGGGSFSTFGEKETNAFCKCFESSLKEIAGLSVN